MGYNNTRSQGGKGAMPPPKFLENMAILWFERRFSKQNRVIRLNSKFCPPPNFLAGYATMYNSQYYVPGTPVRQWQGRGCCEERQEYAQTHLT